MKHTAIAGLTGLVILFGASRIADSAALLPEAVAKNPGVSIRVELSSPRFGHPAYEYVRARLESDLTALEASRPSYPFWQHIFMIPDGAVAFGGGQDGRLLATFPIRGDWIHEGRWEDAVLRTVLEGWRLPTRQDERRNHVASVLELHVGRVVHNSTRGNFLVPNVRRYGSFLDEWSAIYERFGVPAEIGLAQAIVESGFHPTVRSEARAVGFCQWLEGNWNRLKRFSPHVIEGHNQTTQAFYCAAYLATLATKYGSFIPALSEHHAGGANVGRTVINGERLGGADVRDRYFMGAAFALDLRNVSLRRYRDIFRTYGPRSSLYAEMVFGNIFNVRNLREEIPQSQIYAMRTPRSISLEEVTRRTGLSVEEVRRFNPALIRQVPANANIYLPSYVEEFGPDVTFWHQPPNPSFASVFDEFVRIDAPFDRWDDREFEPVLRGFQRRFADTLTEEGAVMATVLEYVMDEAYSGRRGEVLKDFRTSPRIQSLFEQGVTELARYKTPSN